jgi:hypothetical protein
LRAIGGRILAQIIHKVIGRYSILADLNSFEERIYLGPCGVIFATTQGRMSENTVSASICKIHEIKGLTLLSRLIVY